VSKFPPCTIIAYSVFKAAEARIAAGQGTQQDRDTVRLHAEQSNRTACRVWR